jgi:hypothetical protein
MLFFVKKPLKPLNNSSCGQTISYGELSILRFFKICKLRVDEVIFEKCDNIYVFLENIGRISFFYTRVVVFFSLMLRGSYNHCYLSFFILYIVSCLLVSFLVLFIEYVIVVILLLYILYLFYILYIICISNFYESFCNVFVDL